LFVLEILKPESQPSQKHKKFGDGSIGVIHVIKNEYYGLPNPMHRKFREDLEKHQDRRKESNLSLKEEKREDLEKMLKECQKLVKEITMQANDGDVKKICKELAQKEKMDKEKIKKKCRELAKREKIKFEQFKSELTIVRIYTIIKLNTDAVKIIKTQFFVFTVRKLFNYKQKLSISKTLYR